MGQLLGKFHLELNLYLLLEQRAKEIPDHLVMSEIPDHLEQTAM
jgi:hypothetical protein